MTTRLREKRKLPGASDRAGAHLVASDNGLFQQFL